LANKIIEDTEIILNLAAIGGHGSGTVL